MTLPAGSFWRGVGVVLTGAVVAQAVPILGLLVLARLYQPEEFGIFSAWLGIVSIGAVVITGRYEVAIPLEPDGELRRAAVVATLVAIMLALSLVMALTAGAVLFGVLPVSGISLWIAGIPVIALMAISNTLQSWAAADGRYRHLAIMRIAQTSAITGLQILASLFLPSAVGLALAQLVGVAFGVAVAASLQPVTLQTLGGIYWRAEICSFWVRRARFPLLSLPADSINTAAGQLPLLIVASRFGADVAGQLALTMRILGGPISLLGAAVLDVFRRSVAQSWRDRAECYDDYLRTFKVLAAGSICLVLVVAPFSELIFSTVFGEVWGMAGTIALWLLPMFALRFVASPLSYTFYVAGKQHLDLLWQISLLGMTLATMTLPQTYSGALQSYSGGYSLLYVVYLALSYRFSRGSGR